MKLIDRALLDKTSAEAKVNERLRKNFNLHNDYSDPVNRLLNAMEPGTYIRPHRHADPPKNETFIVLRGALDILIFDDLGSIILRQTLSPESGNYGMDIPAGIWHGMIVLLHDTVVYETKTGPYFPLTDKDFASWSPDPSDTTEVQKYLNQFM
ncbi:MAG: WbuC family cupin fold metalloprotein [Prevotellaceae bacterium]|nr:WbuC family cupin fold metalloprotein [Prevotellaceae bacterium]